MKKSLVVEEVMSNEDERPNANGRMARRFLDARLKRRPHDAPGATTYLQWIPNGLTISRVLLTPVIVLLLVRAHDGHSLIVSCILGLAALTDFLDGRLARRWQLESTFGKFADQFADKLILGAVMLLLIRVHRLPWIGLELLVARSFAKTTAVLIGVRPVRFAPSLTGKLGASVIYVALCCVLATRGGTLWPLWVYWAGVAIAMTDVPLKALDIVARNHIAEPALSDLNEG